MAAQSLSGYTGRHDYTFTAAPCGAPGVCSAAGAPITEGPVETYWKCSACTAAATLATLASTLSHNDDTRAEQAARFKQPVHTMALPKATQGLMAEFKKLGGAVRNRQPP